MNNIVIKGRLAKDPETRQTATDKTVCNFSVAVNRRFDKDKSDFFDCQAWDKTADTVQKYFTKGQEIILSGAMQCRQWEDKEGKKRYSWELIVNNVEFCGSKQSEAAAPSVISDFDTITNQDGDLPF